MHVYAEVAVMSSQLNIHVYMQVYLTMLKNIFAFRNLIGVQKHVSSHEVTVMIEHITIFC